MADASMGQISHPSHPSDHGPLVLIPSGYEAYRCDSCYQLQRLPRYKCNYAGCDFELDVKCASMPPRVTPSTEDLSGQQQCSINIQQTAHPHSLLLIHHIDDDDDDYKVIRKCKACKLNISSAYYGCTHCKYFLHKSCGEFPTQISPHSLVHRHTVLSLDISKKGFTCRLCGETLSEDPPNFNFKCSQSNCSFRLCWNCKNRKSRRNIEYEDHDHSLCFVERVDLIPKSDYHCNAYDGYCGQHWYNKGDQQCYSVVEFKSTEFYEFECLNCDFRLHFLCGPLPSEVKYEFHIHSLDLYDYVIEDDFGEYYCDVCETQRDPRIRVYYCKECKYFAHVHCLISEIINILRGSLKAVKLKALGKDYWSHAAETGENVGSTQSTLRGLIFDQLTQDEKRVVKLSFNLDETLSKDDGGRKATRDDGDTEMYKALQLSRFNDGIFQSLINEFRKFYSTEKVGLKASELSLKLVKVKGYLIPYPLADVLKTLFQENGGDHARASPKSEAMKSFVYFILCRVSKRMRNTLVKDITKNILREWYLHLAFAKNQDFETSVATAQFEYLLDAFLGLKAQTLKDEIPKKLQKKIDEMHQKTVTLQRGLVTCKEYQESNEQSEYMKHCLEKASESKWSLSFERSFKDRRGTGSSFPLPRLQY